MKKSFKTLQNKRNEIFRETVKLAFNHELKNNIDKLVPKFTDDIHNKNELGAVKNEFLLAMGLNTNARYDTELSTEVDAALNLKEIEKPLVTVNKTLCEECRNESDKPDCDNACIINQEKEGLLIEDGRCISCGKCISKCPLGAISDKVEFIPMVKYLQENIPVYANVAPAIVGQFGKDITPGMLRNALKSIGFTDMVEVALFADIITLHEVDEYINNVKKKGDFLITSCCCPVWINMISKNYPELYKRLTKIVSPMIASGRVIKMLFPEAITVFIGPCIAKKAEAKEPELKGAIDYVLTFEELNEIFKALDINLNEMPDEQKEQSSYGGRIYGKTGGVSKAVQVTIEKIAPEKIDNFKPLQADGVKNCKELLDDLQNNKIKANFIEGMGCKGGCVGGPKRNISIEDGTQSISNYGNKTEMKNPIENQNVSYILKHLNTINKKDKKQIPEKLELEQLLIRE